MTSSRSCRLQPSMPGGSPALLCEPGDRQAPWLLPGLRQPHAEGSTAAAKWARTTSRAMRASRGAIKGPGVRK